MNTKIKTLTVKLSDAEIGRNVPAMKHRSLLSRVCKKGVNTALI